MSQDIDIVPPVPNYSTPTLIAHIFQTATLDSGTMVSRVSNKAERDSDDSDSEKGASRERLDDEQLFEACGGMTAHK